MLPLFSSFVTVITIVDASDFVYLASTMCISRLALIVAHGPVRLLSRETDKELVKKAMCTATGATDERNWPILVLKDTSSKIIGGSYIPAREGSSFCDEVPDVHSLHPQEIRDGEHSHVLPQR